ncbi:hypothetical protein [Lichenibacterium dinghuense]|uniref:hypothetical protein n=1 Tax=Lichenibacterium dinghuense TaxID=2895977 RepID=UPI001F35B614|nr:hypothetical protein [Lichenibacterium sp. 6Y81]
MLTYKRGQGGSVIPFARPPRQGVQAMPHIRSGNPTLPAASTGTSTGGPDWRRDISRLASAGASGGSLPFGSGEEGVEFTVSEPGPLRPMYLCVAWEAATRLVLAYGFGTTEDSARDATRFHLHRTRRTRECGGRRAMPVRLGSDPRTCPSMGGAAHLVWSSDRATPGHADA